MTNAMKDICALEDIPRLGARRVLREDGIEIAVFRAGDDHLFAVLDRCPHKGGPLSQGIVFGHKVTCPLHAWTIALDQGCAIAPDAGCVKRYPVRVEQGRVLLDVWNALEAGAPAVRTAA